MEKIKISYPNKREIFCKIGFNLSDKKNVEIIRDMVIEQQECLVNYDEMNVEEIKQRYKDILHNLFNLLENTEFKNKSIYGHNNVVEKASDKLKECFRSKSSKLNFGDSLESSSSKDLVTQEFKRLVSNANLDEMIVGSSYWANRMAHSGIEEIQAFVKRFYTEEEYRQNAQELSMKFRTKIHNANKLMICDRQKYGFNRARAIQLMREENFDFENCKDRHIVNAKKVMKECDIPCRNVNDIRNFIYCNNMQDTVNNLFSIKDDGVIILERYLHDRSIPQEKKSLKAIRIRDNSQRTSENSKVSRVVVCKKEDYDKYLKFGDKTIASKKIIEELTADCGDDQKKEKLKEKMEKLLKSNTLTDDERIALSRCNYRVFHVTDKSIDNLERKYGIKMLDSGSQIIESLARTGGNLNVNLDEETRKTTDNVLLPVEENCTKNREKYNNNIVMFCKENKISNYYEAAEALVGKEEIEESAKSEENEKVKAIYDRVKLNTKSDEYEQNQANDNQKSENDNER